MTAKYLIKLDELCEKEKKFLSKLSKDLVCEYREIDSLNQELEIDYSEFVVEFTIKFIKALNS